MVKRPVMKQVSAVCFNIPHLSIFPYLVLEVSELCYILKKEAI